VRSRLHVQTEEAYDLGRSWAPTDASRLLKEADVLIRRYVAHIRVTVGYHFYHHCCRNPLAKFELELAQSAHYSADLLTETPLFNEDIAFSSLCELFEFVGKFTHLECHLLPFFYVGFVFRS
jgi:hypothetical protein